MLVSFIQRYYLGGIVETVRIQSTKDNKLTTDFIAPTKDLVGSIELNKSPLSPSDINIYDTSQLLKLLNITSGELTITPEGGKKVVKINITDGTYTVSYVLADSNLIPDVPKVSDSDYSYSFVLNDETRTKIVKSKGAIGDNDVVWIGTYSEISGNGPDKIELIFGDNSNHSNKISFSLVASQMNAGSVPVPFSSKTLKEIINANKGDDGECFVNKDGLMKIKFANKAITSTYFMVRKNID